MSRIKISPSMMCVDFLNVKQYLDIFVGQGIDYLHIDIMDGHYVPNFSLGPDFCRSLASYADIPLDIHLMVERPDQFVPAFVFPGAIISFHPETSYQPIGTIQRIKSHGMRAGIALDPAMPVEQVRHLIPHVDLVCIMTVNPGYSGQALVPGSIEKIAETAGMIQDLGSSAELEVDGNVSWENIPRMLESGARVLVAGTSSIFQRGGNLEQDILQLRRLIETPDL